MMAMEYPGRMIAMGRAPSGKHDIIIYAITGRSSSSQARKLKFHGERLHVMPAEQDGIGRGDPELLIYPAMMIDKGIAVSNGRQTGDIMLAGTADNGLKQHFSLRSKRRKHCQAPNPYASKMHPVLSSPGASETLADLSALLCLRGHYLEDTPVFAEA